MPSAYAADIAICRAGALIAEPPPLASLSPPFPYAADNHQEERKGWLTWGGQGR